ncbi:hypothetical protein V6D40_09880 [Corynebacterium sp. Q4381]|uniref:hypothetical protein n=1 Tax=Corynebacterium sp. Marseille-Q4381 TaxID=3121597 RepID=UPI002FE675C9
MKRFTAATLAAATSLALVGIPAQAAETDRSSETNRSSETTRSSELDDSYVTGYIYGGKVKELITEGSGFSAPYKKSSEGKSVLEQVNSSTRNDAARGYKVGTTHDILVGTGIAAAILAVLGGGAWAFQQGLIKF